MRTGAETGKRWLFAAVALGVLVASGAVAAMALLHSGALKARIEHAAFRATGRQLLIAGKVRPLWSLNPGIALTNVSLANLPGGSQPQMATVRRVEAHLALVPLLRGQVEITTATLVGPDILLERDAAGRPNWVFQQPLSAPSAPAPKARRQRMVVGFDVLHLEQGRITARDLVPGGTLVADVSKLSLDLTSEPARLGFTAALDGATFTGSGQLDRHAPAAMPLAATLTGAGAAFTLNGAYDPAPATLTGLLSANVPDLATLAAIVPNAAPLPPLRALQVKATLAQMPLPSAAGPGWLSQPIKLEASGTLPAGPWQVAANVVQTGRALSLRGLQASSPAGDLAGDLAWTPAPPRPALRGTLVATRLDADAARKLLALFSPAPAQSPPPDHPPATAPAEPVTAPPRLFSQAPLPWPALRRADADLQFTIGTLHAGGADYRNAIGHLSLVDGALNLAPFSLAAPEGSIVVSATADARAEPPPVSLALRSGSFSVGTLLQAFGLPAGSSGGAEVDVAVRAAGHSPHDLAASLTGHAGVALIDGAIANADLAAALGNVLRSAGLGLDPAGQSAVRCLALRLNAQAGVVSLAALKLDTARLLLSGTGTVDLGTETLALQLRPLLRLGAAAVEAPLRVDGSLLHPTVAMASPSGALGRSGITIGGVAGPADDCSAELTAARDGRPGAMPTAAVASKSLKPADLLRSLLR